jgi:glycosyltransferase involved in cell wall biosynthesis
LTFQPKDEYTQNLKSKLKLKDKKIILFVGRLSYYKGWTFLIHALKEVKKEIKDIVLLIASGYNKEVERFAQDLSIEIKFTGWLSWEMMPNVYNLADLTVVPSIYPDPAPATLFEAMAVKKPIIASIYGGANEIIKDEYTGLLVNPYNTEELAFGIKTLIRDERLCQKLKEAGFKRLNEKFHIKINVKKRLQLYQELICKN